MLASSSSLSGARSETDMESSVMKKSLTLPGSLSQWSKKMSSSWTSFGKTKTRKKYYSNVLSTKSTAELMKNYEFEEDQFLRELELLQETTGSNRGNDATNQGLAFAQQQLQNQHQQRQQTPRQRRPSRSTSEASSVASSVCVSAQSDLLGSFCHLMNYVVHLRRENRHLRKQVLCLQEMRKIEQLQNELIRAACTCCGDGVGSLAVDAASTSASGAAEPSAIMNRNNEPTPTPTVNKQVRGDVITTAKKPEVELEVRSVEKLNRHESASLGRLKSVRKALAESKRVADPLSICSTGRFLRATKDTTPSVAESRTPEDPLSSAASLELPGNGSATTLPVFAPGLPPRPNSSSMADIRRQRTAPTDSRLLTAKSAALLSPRQTTSAASTVRHSAEEALAEPTGADLNHLLMQTSAEFSSSSLLSNRLATNKTTSEDISTNINLSDSEDQTSVFAEVQLPTLKDVTTNCANLISKYRSPRDSRYNPFPTVSVGGSKTTTTPEFGGRNSAAAAILERLGIRPLKSRRSSQQDQEKRSKAACYANFAASPTDWSRCTSGGATGGAAGVPPNSSGIQTQASPDVDKWKLVRKAFIKKRKRKISESDSVASSDTSCKQPYAAIELPDISYTRKNSYPPVVPIVTTVDVEALQRSVNVSKEYTQKMKDWEDKKRFNAANISPKGNLTKRSWLKRSKQQRVDAAPTTGHHLSSNGGERYFEKDDNGRQLTVIQHDGDDDDYDDYGEQRIRSDSRTESSSRNYGNRWLSPNDADRPELVGFGSEINLKDSSDVKAKLAVSVGPRRKEIDKRRSVTFCDHSGADTLSIATSQMTVSNDSVFTSLEADFNNSALCSNGGSDLVQHLLTLQERNSLLIRTLREKSDEYEKITDQLSSLENEVKLLRDRYRYDTALENIYSTLIDPSNYVPCTMVEELENQILTLDTNIRSIKTEAYHTQQITMESYLKEQAASRRYLDQIETLQKTNLQLIQRHLSGDLNPYDPEMRRQFQIIQNYDTLFRFTINLLRKVKHYRCKLLEKHSSVTKLDFELVQTQSSLLLAHAQIERQKMELKCAQNAQRQLRRAQSYDGQDLLLRLINNQMSFYLPFKLHGSRLSKIDHHLSDFSLYDGEDVLENEFARLFESAHRISGNYEELELPMRDFHNNNISYNNNAPIRRSAAACDQNRLIRTNDRPKSCLENHNQLLSMRQAGSSKSSFANGGGIATAKSIANNRPGSCIVPTLCYSNSSFDRLKQNIIVADFDKINEEMPTRNHNNGGNSPQKPVYVTKAPTPLKLNNVGQVRSIAAVFDLPPPNDNPSSAPNTPLSKGAPHLCHSRDNSVTYRRLYDSPPSQVKFQQLQQQQQQQHSVASGNNVVVMRNSSNFNRAQSSADRMAVSSTFKPQSRIPVRQVSVVETPSSFGFSQPLLSSKQSSPPNSERPYETLTFRRSVVKFPIGAGHANHQFLTPGDFMDKSSTPEFETTSLSTSAGSNWSIAKRNEARRRQFFYGETMCATVDPRINATASSNSTGQSPPPPAVSPSPPKSPVPSSPTPLLGRTSSKSSKLVSLALKQHATKEQVAKQSVTPNSAVQETTKKRTSWFQKFRHKK